MNRETWESEKVEDLFPSEGLKWTDLFYQIENKENSHKNR